MPYTRSDGTYVHGELVTLHASAARTATGTGSAVDIGGRNALRSIVFAITAASGTTPTIDAIIQTSHDATTWVTSPFCVIAAGGTATGVYAQKTGVTSDASKLALAPLARYVRVSYTIAGTTPSFTFSVVGELV